MDEIKNTTPSIRIGKKDTLKIEVNDNGDYIELNFGDRTFFNKYYELGKQVKDYGKFLNNFKLENDEDAGENLIEKDFEYNKKIAEQIDKLFGAGTCKKVFDTDVPTIDLITEFLNAIMPFVEKELSKRKMSVKSKYTPKKGGAR